MNTSLTTRYWLKRAAPALALVSWLAIAGLTASAQQAPPASNGDLRFAVAHQHMASWCYGYLYVSGSQVRYEVVQPQTERGHSFAADRANVVVSHRTLFGQTAEALKPFINLKVKGQSYNFLWLANESEVINGGARRMSPPEAAAPDTLFATLLTPPAPPPMQDAAPQSAGSAAGASPANPQAQQPPAQASVPQGDVRFAAAHHHKDASWCYGYLYVTEDRVRYEVVQPASDRTHAFTIDRSSVKARRWVPKANAPAEYVQASQDAFELESQGVLRHFRWLANQDDVTSGNARPANPPQAAPPDIPIRAIQISATGTPEVMSAPSLAVPSKLQLALNRINDARPAAWR
jgi:hypothetical protein